MNALVGAYPNRDLHIILDNLNIHKPKRDRWLARHPRVHLHYTPTHASWLNMIEVWFSILWRAALRDETFTAPHQVRRGDRCVRRRLQSDRSSVRVDERSRASSSITTTLR